MKTMKLFAALTFVITSVFSLISCDLDDDDQNSYPYYMAQPNALVTVKPIEGAGFYMQLDDSTTLYPVNMASSPYGNKEVRALVCYNEVKPTNDYYTKSVEVTWIDSILTKSPIPYPTDGDVTKYGNDPIEIVKDWVTIVEDGYLTLRFRTLWGNTGTAHYINLLTGVNPDDPYEVEFKHNAFGDTSGIEGDALVAFRLTDLPDTNGETVKLTLKYKSFGGEKKIQFDYCSRKSDN